MPINLKEVFFWKSMRLPKDYCYVNENLLIVECCQMFNWPLKLGIHNEN